MFIGESIMIGWREITDHKLRSGLTMLGVIFGVAAVISTAAIGAGAREELERQLAQLGANTIRVSRVELTGNERAVAQRNAPWGLTLRDADALRELIPDVVQSAPIKRSTAQASYGGRMIPAQIIGTSPDLMAIVGYALDEGRFLSALDMDDATPVAVIGDDVRRRAFPLEDPIGQRLVIDGTYYTVVGLLAPRSRTEAGAAIESVEADRSIMIPVTAALSRLQDTDLRTHNLEEIILKTNNPSALRESAALTERILLRRHNGVADFRIVVPEELIRQQQKTKNVLSQVLIFIAAISLLVGGIGIMNIMLASVTQRVKEVGIRRALGATRQDILVQFIIESLIISLLGGLAGIGMGYGLARGIAVYADWTTIIPPEAIIVSVSVAAGIGFFFGLYPSIQASRLDPIEALRAE